MKAINKFKGALKIPLNFCLKAYGNLMFFIIKFNM